MSIKMATIFLVVIYLAFIALGLPDSLLGTAWPLAQKTFGVSLDSAGFISIAITSSTVVSSILSGKVVKKFGTGKITLISSLMTACALLGFAVSPNLYWLVLCAIPLGLGAGCVDASLNGFVAEHFKAHHMSWLHCFWGVGATAGPIIMSICIAKNGNWREGYLTVAVIQFIIVAILLVSMPLWKMFSAKTTSNVHNEISSEKDLANKDLRPMKIKGVIAAMLTFLVYCSIESTFGLWGASFLVEIKEMTVQTAARWVSTYYAGITIGRFLCGFITMRFDNKIMIRGGLAIIALGSVLLFLPLPTEICAIGFVCVGLGCAPIFPCMIHETPRSFGTTHSQTIIGYQMASAYIGVTFLPPIVGVVANNTSIAIFPFVIAIFLAFLIFSTERITLVTK